MKKLVWKLAIPQICVVVLFGLISFTVINSSFSSMREHYVRDVLENRMDFIFNQIDYSAQKSVNEAALFVRMPAVIEAYRIALETENAFDRENPDPSAPEYQAAREYLRKELKPILDSYEEFAEKRIELHFHLPNGLSLSRMWRDPATGEQGTGNDGKGNDVSDDLRSYRFTVMHTLDYNEITLGLEPGSGGFAIRGVIPVIDPGRDGVFGTGDDTLVGSAEVLQQFNPILDAATEEGKVYISLYANQDLTQISPELDNPEKYPPKGDDFIRVVEAQNESFEELITPELLLKGKNSEGIFFEHHGTMTLAVHPLVDYKGEQVGVLIGAMDTSNVSMLAETATGTLILMLACMAVVPTIVLLVLLRILVIRPVNKIKMKIQDIAEDRADLSEQVPSGQKDEIGELAGWFNSLTAKLAGILKERQEMLEEIQSENERTEAMAHWYASILDSIPFMVSVQDKERKWTFANAALEKILGRKREDIIGLPCSNWGVCICGTENCAIECSRRGQDQTFFTHNGASYQVDIEELTDLHGEVTGFIEVIQDITEMEQLMEQEAEATAASEAKSSFLSNMSHEIRTPLNAIIGMTSIGASAANQERMKYCFTKIEDASKHLLGVINDILDMSKIEAGKFELSDTEFRLENILRRVVGVINFRIAEKKQKLDVHIDKEIPKVLIGDDQRLAQVIANLLSNAVKFTPENGNISVDTLLLEEEDDICTLRFTVTDTGIGISLDQQARLFDSFQQADSNTTRQYGGTGLGLSISKNIIEMMGGEIWVESEVGKGSTFVFTIRMERGSDDGSNFRTIDPAVESLRILVVDEDPTVLVYFKEIIKEFGLHCDVVVSTEDALHIMEKSDPFNIIFADWETLGAGRVETIRKLQDKLAEPGKDIVLMLSTTEWNSVEPEVRRIGVNKFITKPIFPSNIWDTINDCMEMKPQNPENLMHAYAGIFARRRILLVEDVEINRDIVVTLLEPTGLIIDTAENGAEAVRMFSEEPDSYGMIFMDVQMPIMDGYEATRQIRALPIPIASKIPIIAMTANVFREDIEKCLESGMNGHVGKPIDLDEVVQQLKTHLLQASVKLEERRKEDRRMINDDRRQSPDRRSSTADRRQSSDRRLGDRRHPDDDS